MRVSEIGKRGRESERAAKELVEGKEVATSGLFVECVQRKHVEQRPSLPHPPSIMIIAIDDSKE